MNRLCRCVPAMVLSIGILASGPGAAAEGFCAEGGVGVAGRPLGLAGCAAGPGGIAGLAAFAAGLAPGAGLGTGGAFSQPWLSNQQKIPINAADLRSMIDTSNRINPCGTRPWPTDDRGGDRGLTPADGR